MRRIGSYYAFAGNALSYATTYQSVQFNTANTDSNSFVMKYLFDKDTNHQCVFEATVQLTLKEDTASQTKMEYYNAEVSETSEIIK